VLATTGLGRGCASDHDKSGTVKMPLVPLAR
jgi:hypothetical protein